MSCIRVSYNTVQLCNPFAATVSNRDDISAITRDDSKAAIYLGPRATSASLSPSRSPCILGAYEYGLRVATVPVHHPSIHLSTTTATRPGTMSNPPESQPLERNEALNVEGFGRLPLTPTSLFASTWPPALNCAGSTTSGDPRARMVR